MRTDDIVEVIDQFNAGLITECELAGWLAANAHRFADQCMCDQCQLGRLNNPVTK